MKNSPLVGLDQKLISGREYVGASRIDGPLVYMRNTHPVGFGELVECMDATGVRRTGQVLDTSDSVVVVQLFEGTSGLTLPGTRMRFMEAPYPGCIRADAWPGDERSRSPT